MKFRITFRKTPRTKEAVDYIERRIAFAFARLFHAIDDASVTVSDINGPRGGVDKQCRVRIKPTGMNSVVVVEKQNTLQLAVDRSISRASHALSRQLKRSLKNGKRRGTIDTTDHESENDARP